MCAGPVHPHVISRRRGLLCLPGVGGGGGGDGALRGASFSMSQASLGSGHGVSMHAPRNRRRTFMENGLHLRRGTGGGERRYRVSSTIAPPWGLDSEESICLTRRAQSRRIASCAFLDTVEPGGRSTGEGVVSGAASVPSKVRVCGGAETEARTWAKASARSQSGASLRRQRLAHGASASLMDASGPRHYI